MNYNERKSNIAKISGDACPETKTNNITRVNRSLKINYSYNH